MHFDREKCKHEEIRERNAYMQRNRGAQLTPSTKLLPTVTTNEQ